MLCYKRIGYGNYLVVLEEMMQGKNRNHGDRVERMLSKMKTKLLRSHQFILDAFYQRGTNIFMGLGRQSSSWAWGSITNVCPL